MVIGESTEVALSRNPENREKITPQYASKKEQQSREPELSFEIFNYPHRTFRDDEILVEEMAQSFAKADIFIPEFFGWRREDLKYFKGISEGVQAPKNDNPVLRLILNCRKPIAFIDVPADHPLTEELEKIKAYWSKHKDVEHNFLYFGTPQQIEQFEKYFKETLGSVKQYLEKLATFQSKRQAFMASQIKPKIRELLEEHPEIRKKGAITILLSIGSGHTMFKDLLQKKGIASDVRVKGNTAEGSFEEKGVWKYMNREKVDDELAARVLFEAIIDTLFIPSLKDRVDDTRQLTVLKRSIVSQFSLDDIREMRLTTYSLDIGTLIKKRLVDRSIAIPEPKRTPKPWM